MNIPGFNRHRSWSELASGFAGDSLEPAEAERFQAHLAGCARCQAAVSDYRAIRIAAQRLPDSDLPRSFRLTPAMLLEPPRDEPLAAPRPGRAVRAVQVGARITAGAAAAALAAIVVIDLGGVATEGTETASTDLASEAAPASGALTGTSAGGTSEEPTASATAAAQNATTPEATAPPDDTPGVFGSSAGSGEDGEDGSEGGESEPPATATASAVVPEPDSSELEDGDAGRSAQDTSTYAEMTTLSQVSGEDSDSDTSTLRVLEVALGVLLVAALGVIVYFPVRRRLR